jgi:hypothetical protein
MSQPSQLASDMFQLRVYGRGGEPRSEDRQQTRMTFVQPSAMTFVTRA